MSVGEKELLDWALQLAIAEEAARAKVEVKPVEVKPALPPTPKTKIKSMTDVKIPAVLLDEKGAGCLKELLIKSSRKDYRLRMYGDDQQLYDNTFDWFQNISQQTEEISAFTSEDGFYILHISDIKFAKNLKLELEPLTTETFKIEQAFYKLDIAEA